MLDAEIEVELQCNKIFLVFLLYLTFLVCVLLQFTSIPLFKVFEDLNIC